MKGVPFTMTDEFCAMRGQVVFGGGSVTLELSEYPDGRLISPPRKVVIDIEELEGCRIRVGSFGPRIILRTYGLGAFGGVSGAGPDSVTLCVDRRYRDSARQFVAQLQAAIADFSGEGPTLVSPGPSLASWL